MRVGARVVKIVRGSNYVQFTFDDGSTFTGSRDAGDDWMDQMRHAAMTSHPTEADRFVLFMAPRWEQEDSIRGDK